MSIASRLAILPLLLSGVIRAGTETWTLRPSASARGGYDDNVFLQDRAGLLPGIVNAVPDHAGSWVARASVTLDAGWHPSPRLQIDAAYSPEIVRYAEFPGENHDDQRLDFGVRGAADAWTYQLKGNLVLVDGADSSPVYGHAGGGPAIGGAGVRARRDQLATKVGGQLTRALPGGFVRAMGDLCGNDFYTRQLNPASVPGYANYVDRAEWSAGLEAGRALRPEFSAVAGVRVGEQRQSDLLGVSSNCTNTLTRGLIGFEGQPRRDLTLRLLAGPDWRRFGDAAPAGLDRTSCARYVETSASWTPGAADAVTLAGKDYLWLSSGGRGAYRHTTASLQWRHTFAPRWSSTLTSEVQVGDSRAYQPAATRRFDWIYVETASLARALSAKTKLDLEVTREWSDSAIADKPGREYTRWLASVGVRHAF